MSPLGYVTFYFIFLKKVLDIYNLESRHLDTVKSVNKGHMGHPCDGNKIFYLLTGGCVQRSISI